MWPPPPGNSVERMHPMHKLVAVAIDKDKGSQIAAKWALDCLVGFNLKPDASELVEDNEEVKDLFLPYRAFCTRKDVSCYEVVLDDTDVARAIVEFVKQSTIDTLVLGAMAEKNFFRFRVKDIPGSVLKDVPDYCTVYVIHKGKISSTRPASCPVPSIISPLRIKIMDLANIRSCGFISGNSRPGSELSPLSRKNEANYIKSPFSHQRAPNEKGYELSEPETDISFISADRRSVDAYSGFYDSSDGVLTPPRLSGFSEVDYQSLDSWHEGCKSVDAGHRSGHVGCKSVVTLFPLVPPTSFDNELSFTGQSMEEIEAEMRRLKRELKQTIDLYSTACKEALSAKEKEGAPLAGDALVKKVRDILLGCQAKMVELSAALITEKRTLAKALALLPASFDVAPRSPTPKDDDRDEPME